MHEIQDCMKRNVVSIHHTTTLAQAAQTLVERRIGLLPVVDDNKYVLGILGLRDLLEMALPDFVRLLENLDFIQDFGVVESSQPSLADLARPVTHFMRPATIVHENCGLLRAYAIMLEHRLHDLPVVDRQEKLVGIASRVDLGVAVISYWELSP